MHYVVLATRRRMEFEDGPVAETWHDRWRPTLRQLMTLIADISAVRHRVSFDALLRQHLSVAKRLLAAGLDGGVGG